MAGGWRSLPLRKGWVPGLCVAPAGTGAAAVAWAALPQPGARGGAEGSCPGAVAPSPVPVCAQLLVSRGVCGGI